MLNRSIGKSDDEIKHCGKTSFQSSPFSLMNRFLCKQTEVDLCICAMMETALPSLYFLGDQEKVKPVLSSSRTNFFTLTPFPIFSCHPFRWNLMGRHDMIFAQWFGENSPLKGQWKSITERIPPKDFVGFRKPEVHPQVFRHPGHPLSTFGLV